YTAMSNNLNPDNPKGEDKKAFDHQKPVIKCFFFHFRLVMSQPHLLLIAKTVTKDSKNLVAISIALSIFGLGIGSRYGNPHCFFYYLYLRTYFTSKGVSFNSPAGMLIFA
ncbi:hypothetical protein, partial [Virgibacillus halodenitrificans]|uniref:hypothetical protein n=1 Tax=Virgibacillus halodenitrificans TaxID=1482 RepID=UPI003B2278A0